MSLRNEHLRVALQNYTTRTVPALDIDAYAQGVAGRRFGPSDIRPLPHQIKAVYEELLPQTPLRLLLADDPGAGKTIMAGLYAKELMLRGDLQRMLIIAPGGLAEQCRTSCTRNSGSTPSC